MVKNGTGRYIKDILHGKACKRHIPIVGDVFYGGYTALF
jgi:hypothetical protein